MSVRRFILAGVIAFATASAAHAMPLTTRPAKVQPSSTFGPGVHRHDLEAGNVIAICIGVGIFAAICAIQLRRNMRQARTLTAIYQRPGPLDFSALRAAMPSFSRIEFEHTAARLVAEHLAKRGTATPLVADLRVTAVTASSITCGVTTVLGDRLHAGNWTFERTGDTWKIAKVDEVTVGGDVRVRPSAAALEVGNNLRTIADDDAIERFAALRSADSSLTWDSFVARVRDTFSHYEKQDASTLAGYATPRLLETAKAYAAFREREGVSAKPQPELRHVELAQVVREPADDLVTVRVYQRTPDASFSEYWTFTRAPQGEWQLHRVDQDELYAG